jgi:hypothetical protein
MEEEMVKSWLKVETGFEQGHKDHQSVEEEGCIRSREQKES